MFRFGRILGVATPADERRLQAVVELFPHIFPLEASYAAGIEPLIRSQSARDFDVTIITAEEERGRVLGFALFFYFPDTRCAFLDYIGSDPRKRKRGIGRSLYEAVREYLAGRGARGLFLEIPPDEPDDAPRGSEQKKMDERRSRARFYEQFGARPIIGTLWNNPPIALDYDPPYLVFDPLGRSGGLSRSEARRAAAAILKARYHIMPDDPSSRTIVASFRDDPVRLRAARYEESVVPVKPMHDKIRPIKVVASEVHEIHHVRERGYVERPARVRTLLRSLKTLPIDVRPVPHAGEAPIRAVHDPDFVRYLKKATDSLGEAETLYPQVFPVRRPERKPREMAIRCGYYCSDTFTPLSRSAYKAARAAIDCALAGAALLEEGEDLVYAICRPPGHHAERKIYGGFCYFNNAAVAAHQLSRLGTVAILDIDYHHGNGQQDIFYQRADVLTISIHGHPADHYPYFAGYPDERGEGAGKGANRNLTIRSMVGDDGYLEVLALALKEIRQFQPRWLLIALGFDIMQGDPTGNFGVTAKGMTRIGETIGRAGLPTLVVQEGGYTLRNLSIGARAFFAGLVRAWYEQT